MADTGESGAPGGGSRRGISLRARILVSMILVAMAPLVIATYQGYHCARQAIVASERQHLRAMLESRRARFDAALAEIVNDLRMLAGMVRGIEAACGHGKGAEAAAGDSRKETPDLEAMACSCSHVYDMFGVYDSRWSWIGGSETVARNGHARLPAGFKERLSQAHGLVLGLGENPAGPGKGPGLFVGLPILDAEGRKQVYVIGCLDLARTFEGLLQGTGGSSREPRVFLVDETGRYLGAGPGDRDRIGLRGSMPPEMLRGDSKEVFEYRDTTGEVVLGTAAPLEVLDARLVAELNRRVAFAWLRVLKRRAALTASFTLLVVVLVAWKSAKRLARPLQQLSGVARRIAGGAHHERVPPLEGAEAEEVARAFNHMLDQLQLSQRRLVHAASLAAIGELSSSIVHEMRNPLSSVKLNLQALTRRLKDDPTYRELSQIALDQAGRLERMLEDLLGFGKPLPFQPTDLVLGELLDAVLPLVRERAAERELRIEADEAAAGIAFRGDPELLKRALTNLLDNAVRAARQGGLVRIRASLDPARGGQVVIHVKDDGPGIPEHLRESLFQPFVSSRSGGTGLGLANVKKIVEYHGGTVRAENREEGGARFTIVLPRDAGPQSGVEAGNSRCAGNAGDPPAADPAGEAPPGR
jgi:signal transduction histidine kinase